MTNSPPRVLVQLVGGVAIAFGERPGLETRLSGQRASLVLAALALADGPLSAARLAWLIWGDEPPTTWPDAVRGLIRGLRKAARGIGVPDSGLVETTASGYQLAPAVDVDVRRGPVALTEAEQLLVAGELDAAGQALASCSRSGEILPEVEAPWLVEPRRRLNEQQVRALVIEAELLARTGRHAEAVEAANTAIERDPLNERAHRVCIRIFQESGDRAAAVLAYERCRTTLAEGLGVDPSPATVEAYLAVLQFDGLGAGRTPIVPSSPLVGRSAELAQLAHGLSVPGVVTLVGRGGVGKTRLALEAVSGPNRAAGVHWVSVSSLADDELVASTVALGVGARVGSDEPTAALCRMLAPAGRVTLVLDGADRVLDGAATLVDAVTRTCPLVSVLVTSRSPLSVDGERIQVLQPLATPETADSSALSGNPSVRLLLERVADLGDAAAVGTADAASLALLCRRAGGLPLALELIAAQLSTVAPADLVYLLEHDTAADDQLRSVVGRSYDMLTPEEAQVFRRFAVFEGPVRLPLIRAVVADEQVAPVRVVRILRTLTESGMLKVDQSGPRWRYLQDDDLQRFALAELERSSETVKTFERLAAAITSLLPADAKAPPTSYAADIDEVQECLRGVLIAARDGRLERAIGLELAFRLHRYWAASNVAEGRFWLRSLLEGASYSSWTGHAKFALGYLGYWSGDVAEAVPLLREAAEILGGVDDWFAARGLIFLSGMADDTDHPAEAVDSVRRSIELARVADDIDLLAAAEMGMGCVLAERGDPAAAGYALRAIELYERGGTTDGLAAAVSTAAMVCWQVGALEPAREFADRGRPMHEGRRRIARVVMLSAAAGIALADDEPALAVELGTTAETEADDLGVDREMPLIRCVLAQALLQTGDRRAATRRTLAALESATALSYPNPLALCLETAAMVLLATATDLAGPAQLLSSAAAIRARGDRPVPATLSASVARAVLAVAGVEPGAELPAHEAATLAESLLRAVLGSDPTP